LFLSNLGEPYPKFSVELNLTASYSLQSTIERISMDKQTVVDLVSDRVFQDAIHSLVDKTPVETVSFIAVSIATVIAALSFIVAIIQLRRQMVEWNNSSAAVAKQLSLLKTSIDEDHRRSRREFAIDLIRSWETSQQHESTSVMFFVEELKYDQCICLSEQKPLKVGEPALSKLLACLQHSFANAKEDNLKACRAQSIRIEV
jgi:hypothetical protein